ELGTQVLMGHIVRIWKREGGWYYVQSSDRYLGWCDDDSFTRVTKEQVNQWNASPRVMVTDYEDRVWQQPGGKRRGNLPVTDVVAGNILKKTGEDGDWFKVQLPDGRSGYLSKASAENFDEWKASRNATGESIEEAAKSLLGVPYLWGGTSTKGVDCSGFTKTVYLMNGIHLLRNASHQARQGTDVPLDANFANLRKGDLLFFGTKAANGKPERVTHVGIYLENKEFIHASGLVRINSLDPKSPIFDERRLKGLLRARRYLN
ncbi:MAG: NlpC/P60 family protein, partial [Limisphaerales bacterium]